MSSSTSSRLLYTALIRTHHITSRKKLQRVKKSARQLEVPYVLVRSGGAPGIMYAEAPEENAVASWVAAVRDLRYKDFQCARKPTLQRVLLSAAAGGKSAAPTSPSFQELETTAEFGHVMEEKGLTKWWGVGMGYQTEE